MNSMKKFEINQSSLLGLKAELLRKKNEVSNAKYSQELTNTKVIKKKLTTKFDHVNPGVSEREERDAEEIQQEADELKKSQRILEEKAKLYDRLANNVAVLGSNSRIDASNFLVDFEQKNREEAASGKGESEKVESDEGEIEDDYSDDDEGWVDFVDCLGRTKRCLREDLEAMREQDEKLRVSLFGEKTQQEEKEQQRVEKGMDEVKLPQLCSEDMKREIMRQKWEEQERKLLDKKNIHYQDVLFDEARTHGVSYYAFSTDEEERSRQQEELKKLRKETQQQQTEAQSIAQKKQKQMEERLKAARRRKRERLGLPPEEESEVEEVKEPEKPPEVEELRRDVRKPGPLRPWDEGKHETRVLSQEEWVEKKRAERNAEFAPPSFPKKQKYQRREREPTEYTQMEAVPIEDELEVRETRGRGVEVPPPESLDAYKPKTRPMSQSEISRSVEEGLEFLRKQVEGKKSRGARELDESDIF